MKWFKHDTNASDDIKIKMLEEEYGNDGYSVFFKSCEILGKDGQKGRLKFEKYPKKWLSSRCHISEEKLTEILNFMGKISLCCHKSLKKNELYISNFRKRADDYTKRLRRLSEVDTEKVPLDKNRIDKIREEYIRVKGFSIKDFTSDDYGRTAKAIKTLLLKAKYNDDLVIRALGWASKQTWCDWTLETVIKKWHDFLRSIFKKAPEDILKKQIEEWKKEERFVGNIGR